MFAATKTARGQVYTADPHWSSVSLLLLGDGTQGGTTFTDSSPNATPITRLGTPITTSAQAKSNQSILFTRANATDVLTRTTGSSDSPFTFGTGDFTIEFWAYFNSTPSSSNNQVIIDFRPLSTNGAYPVLNCSSSYNGRMMYFANTGFRIDSGVTPQAGQWYHFALSRVSSNTRLFVNGVQGGVTYADTTNYTVGTGTRPYIGAGAWGSNSGEAFFDGYMDELRITKGVGRYTTTFTPPVIRVPGARG